MNLTIQQIIQATGGQLLSGNTEQIVTSISTDTRTLKKGDFYIPLKGTNFDGHDFIEEAIQKGVIGILVGAGSPRPGEETLPLHVIQVQDTLKALGDIAHAWRIQFNIPLIGITGSNGKTTTKEMLSSILSVKGEVLKTLGNLNNLIGLPLTLLNLTEEKKFAVIEMGMNAPGEIARLTEIASPTIGLITNVGRAHLAGFDDLAGVAKAKGELFCGLSGEALAIKNNDDVWIPKMKTHSQSLSYGWQAQSSPEILCTFVDEGTDTMSLTIHYRQKEEKFTLPVVGKHYVYSALACYAVATSLNFSNQEIQEGFSHFKALKGRGESAQLSRNVLVIDDTYNANPDSMFLSLSNLQKRFPQKRRVAVLGEMFELGEASDRLHRELGERARELGIEKLYAFGERAAEIVSGFQGTAEAFNDIDALNRKLIEEIKGGDVVLVKGSRGSRMERVVLFLKEALK